MLYASNEHFHAFLGEKEKHVFSFDNVTYNLHATKRGSFVSDQKFFFGFKLKGCH